MEICKSTAAFKGRLGRLQPLAEVRHALLDRVGPQFPTKLTGPPSLYRDPTAQLKAADRPAFSDRGSVGPISEPSNQPTSEHSRRLAARARLGPSTPGFKTWTPHPGGAKASTGRRRGRCARSLPEPAARPRSGDCCRASPAASGAASPRPSGRSSCGGWRQKPPRVR